MDSYRSVQKITTEVWPKCGDSFSNVLRQLAAADQGRHWQHTLSVVANIKTLLAGPAHPDWPRIETLLAGDPMTLAWIDQIRPTLDPHLLQAVALLHDVGKGISLFNHEEMSYCLVKQALGESMNTDVSVALAGLVVRHHAAFSALQTGEASCLILEPLIEDVRRCRLDPERFLNTLIFLTLADWAAYNLLTLPAARTFLTYADFLRRPIWRTGSSAQIRQHLWQEAITRTPERLANLVTFAYLSPSEPDTGRLEKADTLGTAASQSEGLIWPDFQRRFALIRLDGGYAFFARGVETFPSLEQRTIWAIRQLGQWLPSAEQVRRFENGAASILSINLRDTPR